MVVFKVPVESCLGTTGDREPLGLDFGEYDSGRLNSAIFQNKITIKHYTTSADNIAVVVWRLTLATKMESTAASAFSSYNEFRYRVTQHWQIDINDERIDEGSMDKKHQALMRIPHLQCFFLTSNQLIIESPCFFEYFPCMQSIDQPIFSFVYIFKKFAWFPFFCIII